MNKEKLSNDTEKTEMNTRKNIDMKSNDNPKMIRLDFQSIVIMESGSEIKFINS